MSLKFREKQGVSVLNKQKFQNMIHEFTLDQQALRDIAANFRYDVARGIDKSGESSLRMLKSYVGLPTGGEKGEYLALDFGGTNVRVLRIRLEGQGKFTVLKKVAKPLTFPGVYDFVGAEATAEELFDFIAGIVDEAIDEDHSTEYLLGHTFSFPSEQTNLYNAKLIVWTKEFATQGVEGKVVNDLLQAALKRNGLRNVKPVAVINDTVAVLLAAAYKQADTYIASIYATGHNTCYLEPYHGQAKKPMVINLEAGGFNKLMVNAYDRRLDEASEKPGEQRLEKMVSGRYLGDLFALCLADGLADNRQYEFSSIDISRILADESDDYPVIKTLLGQKTGMEFAADECAAIKDLATAIAARSARIVAATYAGIIWHLDGTSVKKQHIAVDGSVYEKVPHAAENIRSALYEVLGEAAADVDTVLENGGSGLGAAIAAAIEPGA